jgi:hypothetical protein
MLASTLSAVFAAIAAVGSAGAAALMYRQWSDARTPRLNVDVIATMPSGRMFLAIQNYGGPAKKVAFTVIEGEQAAGGVLPPNGHVGPGESARLQLGFDMTEEHKQVAVVYGYDLDGRRVYAWAANGQSRCWRLRGLLAHRGELMALDILRAFYPDAPDPTTLQARSVILLPAEGTAGERLPGSPSLIR